MSLIGMLEQFSLTSVFQRIEAHAKTGLFTVKQGMQWVEFYFRDGRLLCVGPQHSNATLAERLLQDGVISQQSFLEIRSVLGPEEQNETRVALTLMDQGLVKRDALRSWAIQKTVEALRTLLSWKTGELHFIEDALPPSERLLVSMSASSLLEAASASAASTAPATPAQPAPQPPARPVSPAPSNMRKESSQATPAVRPAPEAPLAAPAKPVAPGAVKNRPLPSPAQLFDAAAFDASPFAQSLPSTESSLPIFAPDDAPPDYSATISGADLLSPMPAMDRQAGFAPSMSPPSFAPAPAMEPPQVITPPQRIDTSYMQPDMILLPADLSALRGRNVQFHLTPDQWRLLTRVDGKTTLQMACQELAMVPELLCRVAGELIAEGLIYLATPGPQPQTYELSPVSRELAASGLAGGYVAPGYAAATPPPWSAPVPAYDLHPQFSSATPFETESQWGNGGNGATFIPGRGWITSPQPLQPLQSSGIYAQVGGVGR